MDKEAALTLWAGDCRLDPLKFVLEGFAWGEAELEGWDGPDTWQRETLEAIGREVRRRRFDGIHPVEPLRIATTSGHGIGKALAHGEPILGERGWIPVEFVRIGDRIFSGDGTLTNVVGVFPQGERDLFRVWLDDGCSVTVDGEHQWFTTTRGERKRGKFGQIRTTSQIAASLTFPNGSTLGLNHQIPVVGWIEHPTAVLPIEPYLFGCWLGDGDGQGRITGLEAGFEQLVAAGAEFGTPVLKNGTIAVTRTALGIRPALRLLGQFGCRSHEKSIPRLYLHSHVRQRIALLQGLLDTDGSANGSGAVTFEVTSQRLADDTAELVRSLGGIVRRTEKIGSYSGKVCRRVYRLFLSLPREIAPFRLPSKIARYNPQWGTKNCDRTRRRHISAVEPIGRGAATCLAVAHPSHLFVTRDHIVTHNSALTAWIILWVATTRPRSKGTVTANTMTQLGTKTWAELAKWKKLFVCGHWFNLTTGKMSMRLSHRMNPDGWRCDAQTCKEENSEAFAGQHAADSTSYYLFDEASRVPDIVWDVAEGGLTDGEPMLFAFGNPTQNSGRFREIFGKFRHRWICRQIDARDCKLPNKQKIAQDIADYGEDSDFVRIRHRGIFPRSGTFQFIDSEVIDAAEKRAGTDLVSPIVFGVDVARFGDDATVIAIRRGRDARSLPWKVMRNVDTMTQAAAIIDLAAIYSPKAIFVDGGGVGGGVVDRLRFLGQPVFDIQFGGSSDRLNTAGSHVYANKRAEMWGSMREWLKGGSIPVGPELRADLECIEYGYVDKAGKTAILLEKKEDMKKRGLASSDFGDALALTFAYPIGEMEPQKKSRRPMFVSEYNPFDALNV